MHQALFAPLQHLKAYEELKNAPAPLAVTGLCDAQKAHIAAALARDSGRPVLFVASQPLQALRVLELVSAMVDRAVHLPVPELTFRHVEAKSREIPLARMEALSKLGTAQVTVASIDALLHRTLSPARFEALSVRIAPGMREDPQALVRRLVSAGYRRVEMLEDKGQVALRGGILDVYPPGALNALRIEFFDDEIDSLRAFDVMTQRSIDRVEEALLYPAAEALCEDGAGLAARLGQEVARLAEKLGRGKGEKAEGEEAKPDKRILAIKEEMAPERRREQAIERASAHVKRLCLALEAGDQPEALAPFAGYFLDASPIEWLDDPIILIDEPARLEERCENLLLEFSETLRSALEVGDALAGQGELLFDPGEIKRRLARHRLLLLQGLSLAHAGFKPKTLIELDGRAAPQYFGQPRLLAQDLRHIQASGATALLFAGGVARAERLLESLREEHLSARLVTAGQMTDAPGIQIVTAALQQGFVYPSLNFYVFGEVELFGSATRKGGRVARKKAGEKLSAFTDISPGDLVVHESHGIARYQGTVRLQVEGKYRDYLHLEYQGGDKLYVPTDQLGRVQKYIGSQDSPPKVNRLGGSEWAKAKQKVKAAIEDMAEDLVKLYARRKTIKGFTFSPDTPWQREFEESFPYQETPDQLQSIAEIKADMESTIVMDRLLCGDVGYGKTEVAFRAAFKAVMDNKQVGLLAPTTVLAQQHFHSIRRRFEGFPVRAGLLSRFQTPKELKDTLAKLAAGEIDILVGTHKLLGESVRFKNLGLLVIDEEQRFGVGHKEKIKQMKNNHNVDVLTLSATPIPRTLHMSMVGIRDMSLLESPPEERYPVQTYVVGYSDSLIRDVIAREMARGGQVYFLYNRVESIDLMHSRLRQLVPQARIAVGHGQMKSTQLEDVMLDFYENKFDVLLATTIIESGLDIPNANTLIVYDADRFGLSQLYQLRGRVGRSNRLAYAYLTVRQEQALSETAQKRLDAIRQFTEFGAGFKIALRDLEIRGAGNLLGSQQHGFLASVGYDLYCKMLEDAMRAMRGEAGEMEVDTRIELRLDAFLPREYVGGDWQRMEVYKKIAAISNRDEREDMLDELIDRFGDVPESVLNLLRIAHLRALASRMGMDVITKREGRLRMQFAPNARVDPALLVQAIQQADKRLVLSATTPPALLLPAGDEPEKTVEEAVGVLEKIMACIDAQKKV